jgi:hypothetical protein
MSSMITDALVDDSGTSQKVPSTGFSGADIEHKGAVVGNAS